VAGKPVSCSLPVFSPKRTPSSALGSNGGQAGVYGTLGTPAAGNAPGGRYAAANWTDSSGHLWLFGGWGYDGNGNSGYLNDLWEFSPATSEWVWISGSSTVGGHDGQPKGWPLLLLNSFGC
jgi:hypothetical protein